MMGGRKRAFNHHVNVVTVTQQTVEPFEKRRCTTPPMQIYDVATIAAHHRVCKQAETLFVANTRSSPVDIAYNPPPHSDNTVDQIIATERAYISAQMITAAQPIIGAYGYQQAIGNAFETQQNTESETSSVVDIRSRSDSGVCLSGDDTEMMDIGEAFDTMISRETVSTPVVTQQHQHQFMDGGSYIDSRAHMFDQQRCRLLPWANDYY